MAIEKPNLGGDKTVEFTPEHFEIISKITGAENPYENQEQFKEHFEKIKSEREIVKETTPYKFNDEYIENAVKHYNKTGDLTPYVQSNVDYTKFEAEALIRKDIQEQHDGLSAKAVDTLVKKELAQYTVADDAGEDDKSLQQELLGVRATKLRNKFTEEQKKFIAPEKPSVDIEKWKSDVTENAATKGLVTNKNIGFKFGEGETASEFNLDVANPDSLVEMTIDNTNFFKKLTNEDGTTNLDLWYKIAAYVSDPKSFEDHLIGHGKSIGAESVVKEVKNQSLTKARLQGADAGGLLQAFADKGRTVNK